MPPLTYDELAERVREYEFALIQIADKPRENADLFAHLGIPLVDPVQQAYRKCGALALGALTMFHPDLTREEVRRLDHDGRMARGWFLRPLPEDPALDAGERNRDDG